MRGLARDDDYMNDDAVQKIMEFCRRKGISEADLSELETLMRDPGSAPAQSNMRDVQRAEHEAKGVLTAEDMLACDSAPQIYGKALRRLGVSTAGISPTAYGDIFRARRRSVSPVLATDAATGQSFAERFPAAARIKTASPGKAW